MQVARLDTIKDHHTALTAIKQTAVSAPYIRLLIVGDGPQRGAIERCIREQSLTDRVSVLGMRNDVPRLLAASDVFLLTSVSEGIPVTVLEAMAAGVPVVATAVGGLPELIRNEDSGLLAPAGDASGLANALLRLALRPALRSQFAGVARRRALTEFSAQAMLVQYAALYREMLCCRAH